MHTWHKIKCELRYHGTLNKHFESIAKGVHASYWYHYLVWGYFLHKLCTVIKCEGFFNLNSYFTCDNLLSFYFTCAFKLSLFFTFFTSKSKPNFFFNLWQYTKVKFELKWVYICPKSLYQVSILPVTVNWASFLPVTIHWICFILTCETGGLVWLFTTFIFYLWDRGFM